MRASLMRTRAQKLHLVATIAADANSLAPFFRCSKRAVLYCESGTWHQVISATISAICKQQEGQRAQCATRLFSQNQSSEVMWGYDSMISCSSQMGEHADLMMMICLESSDIKSSSWVYCESTVSVRMPQITSWLFHPQLVECSRFQLPTLNACHGATRIWTMCSKCSEWARFQGLKEREQYHSCIHYDEENAWMWQEQTPESPECC